MVSQETLFKGRSALLAKNKISILERAPFEPQKTVLYVVEVSGKQAPTRRVPPGGKGPRQRLRPLTES
jgi:hypothetical protein